MPDQTWDIVVVGAGLSGIDAAYRIQERLPGLSYTILEARERLGGTWDLFQYPGIRSDSDLITFGFPFQPWTNKNLIASGQSIVEYMADTAKTHGIDQHFQFQHRITHAAWSSAAQRWTLTVQTPAGQLAVDTRFLFLGTGYYDYESPLPAHIPGIDSFTGTTIHPQFWPRDLDYTDKNIIIIGSGATAVTLLPALAPKARHVTMLQRSATYIAAMAQRQPPVRWWSRFLPARVSYEIIRLQLVFFGFLFYQFCRRFPARAKTAFLARVEKMLPPNVSLSPNFTPTYNLWDQRVCVAPDGDFYKALHTGKAAVQTGVIQRVTPTGIALESGAHLDADMIVTATGLRLRFAGGIAVRVDGADVDLAQRFLWKGMMIQGVPNTAFAFGYGNASWTLGADVSALGFCRLVAHMQRQRLRSATPTIAAGDGDVVQESSMVGLQSTYLKVGGHVLPRVGSRAPWTRRTNYLYDYWLTAVSTLTNGLQFSA